MLQPPSLPLHAILPQACFGLTAGPLIDSIHNQKLLGEQGLHANLSSPRRAHPSPAHRALPAESMAMGGARPRAGGGTAAPRKRKPSSSLAALREWRNGLSHREPRVPQRAQTVNV